MKKIILSLSFAAFLFLAIAPVFADVTIDNPLAVSTVPELINKIIDIIFTLSLWVAPLLIIVAGVMFVTATGNPTQIKNAQSLILWTLIGLVVIILAKGIITLFRSAFGI